MWYKKLSKFTNFNTATFIIILLFIALNVELNKVNFPINDDWIFKLQIDSFLLGDYTINALIDPSFIAQMLVGGLWAKVFGSSFISLRYLTVIITVISALTITFALKTLKTKPKVINLILILFLFNPLIYHLSLTFMTDNYFLLPYALSIYFYIKHLASSKNSSKNKNKKTRDINLYMSVLFTGISILVRPVGIVTFIAIALVEYKRDKNLSLKRLIVSGVILSIFIYIYQIWPRYNFVSASNTHGLNNLLSNLSSIDQTTEKFYTLIWSYSYIAFGLLPIFVGSSSIALGKRVRDKKISISIPKKRTASKIISLIAIIYLTIKLFNVDVFPIGNILYLEGLNIKAYFRHNFSLFNNHIFRAFLAASISYTAVKFIELLSFKFSEIKKSDTKSFLLLVSVGMIAILLFGNDLYDRYLIPAFVSILILVPQLKNVHISEVNNSIDLKRNHNLIARFLHIVTSYNLVLVFYTLLIVVLSISLQKDYIEKMSAKWELAKVLQTQHGYVNQVFLDGTYLKYTRTVESGDLSGRLRFGTSSDYRCYIRDFTKHGVNFNKRISKFEKFDERLRESWGEPKPFGVRKQKGIPKVKSHMEDLWYIKEYKSPMYEIFEKNSYVGAWCE